MGRCASMFIQRNRTGRLGHLARLAWNGLDQANWAKVNCHVEPAGNTGGIGDWRGPWKGGVQLLGKLRERHIAARDQPRRERIG